MFKAREDNGKLEENLYLKPVLKALRRARSKKGVTLGQLKKVYRRGQGAWLSGSRPKIGMTAGH